MGGGVRWVDVPGYSGLYQVSACGEVFGVKRGKRLAQAVGADGYCRVRLTKHGVGSCHLVHRLVLQAFRGIPDGYDGNHLSGDKSDNRLSNLEAVTRRENVRHAIAAGLRSPFAGAANPRAKLSEDDVRAIRRLGRARMSARALAAAYGVTAAQVRNVLSRRSWAQVADDPPAAPPVSEATDEPVVGRAGDSPAAVPPGESG
jgi:hypothetical protein